MIPLIGPQGIRVVCLRSAGSPEEPGVRRAFSVHAKAADKTLEGCRVFLESGTLMRRLLRLTELAHVAALIASDHASGMKGTVCNLTSGAIIDDRRFVGD